MMINHKCKNFLVRMKQGCPYFYCKIKKCEITLDCHKNCSNLILKTNRGICKRSIKQNKLEKTRNDIKGLDKQQCYYCQRYCLSLDKHEVFGGSNRKRSIQNGFVVNLCRKCHSDEEIIKRLRIIFQKKYEEDHTRADFINLIGKSYLED